MKTFVFAAFSMAFACQCLVAQPTQISQASIVANGTNRSTGGFPFVINQPGSYQLTSNLVVPAGVVGINILSNNVTLDLNGFTISGPVTCTGQGSTLSCTSPASIPDGIFSSFTNLTVRNGSVVGFYNGVVLTGQGGLVEEIHASGNTALGINVTGGVARRNTANLNGLGISASSSTVTENVANFNASAGFDASAGGVFGSNTFQGNGGVPIIVSGVVSQGNNACNGVSC